MDGECEKIAELANIKNNEILMVDDLQPVTELLQLFLEQKAKDINNYYDLAREMAAYTKTIKNAILLSLGIETETEQLNQLKETLQKILILDIDNQSFADKLLCS